MAASSAID
jgi:hypothetical protein